MNTCNPRTQKARQEDQKLKVIQSYLKNGLKNKQYKKNQHLTFLTGRRKKMRQTSHTHARTHTWAQAHTWTNKRKRLKRSILVIFPVSSVLYAHPFVETTDLEGKVQTLCMTYKAGHDPSLHPTHHMLQWWQIICSSFNKHENFSFNSWNKYLCILASVLSSFWSVLTFCKPGRYLSFRLNGTAYLQLITPILVCLFPLSLDNIQIILAFISYKLWHSLLAPLG